MKKSKSHITGTVPGTGIGTVNKFLHKAFEKSDAINVGQVSGYLGTGTGNLKTGYPYRYGI
jgi:hypothetical protein